MPLLSINHHYVREIAPPQAIYPITIREFQRRIAILHAKFRILTENQLIQALETGSDDQGFSCFLTFDDGLAEQMNAAALLERLGLAAVFFIPTAAITERRLASVHKTHILRSIVSDEILMRDIEKQFGERICRIDLASAVSQYPYDTPAAQRLKYIINFVLKSDGELFINRAFELYCGSDTSAADQLYMSRDDVRWLAARGMLGTHGHSHRPLAQLAAADIEREIARSIDILQVIGGREVIGISYPYGGPSAISDEVYSAAGRCGLRYGFTMIRGRNSFAECAAPLALHRYDTQDVEQLVTSGIVHAS